MEILLGQMSVNVSAQDLYGQTVLHLVANGTGIDEDLELKRLRFLIELGDVKLNLRD